MHAHDRRLWFIDPYNGGKVTSFTVPSGRNIFNQAFDDASSTAQDNFQVTNVVSAFDRISRHGGTATFCHACAKNGYRWGDTCWAIVPPGDNHRQCGCCSGGWTGEGIYYGGYKSSQVCGGQGGGFVGQKGNGAPKGSMPSVGLTLQIQGQA